ncbi:hypothetical protein O181_078813 [Austropuccinia psidii MF-1]|uniref:Uncharacterized protein n=1 Tax=Austropuccinia psidii MF-1 TaxID=1389203 RepID=A0A9Q3FJP2_9BASI|nr:hypothetical protein [Austropuccinia psidii MF-1]
MDEHLRKSLFWRTWECQDWFNLQYLKIKPGSISKISRGYMVENAIWDCHWEETLIPAIISLGGGATELNKDKWSSFCQEYFFKILKREKWRGGEFLKQELVKEILGQKN